MKSQDPIETKIMQMNDAEILRLRRDIAWTDDGYYHTAKSGHPGICAGCTSDESKIGKPIITPEHENVRVFLAERRCWRELDDATEVGE